MSLLCAIIGHRLNKSPNRLGERWCIRKHCTHTIPALRWPSPWPDDAEPRDAAPYKIEGTRTGRISCAQPNDSAPPSRLNLYLTRPLQSDYPTLDDCKAKAPDACTFEGDSSKTLNFGSAPMVIYDNQAILAFIEEYEFGDEQVYIPTEHDKLMLTDFAYGLIDLLDQRARIQRKTKGEN